MSEVDLIEAVSVLRDEVLDTAERGDRDPPGAEVFDALLRALAIGGESIPGLDLQLHDAVARRLAWGDSEEAVLADAEQVFDRLMISIERAFRDPADRMVLIETATQVAATVARVVALAAFDDEAAAISMANDTDAGLIAYLWTRDGARQARVVDALDGKHTIVELVEAQDGHEARMRMARMLCLLEACDLARTA